MPSISRNALIFFFVVACSSTISQAAPAPVLDTKGAPTPLGIVGVEADAGFDFYRDETVPSLGPPAGSSGTPGGLAGPLGGVSSVTSELGIAASGALNGIVSGGFGKDLGSALTRFALSGSVITQHS
jgi:hypothetical protein